MQGMGSINEPPPSGFSNPMEEPEATGSPPIKPAEKKARAEEEARLVIAEKKISAEARTTAREAAKARVKAEKEAWVATAKAKAEARAAAEAKLPEGARAWAAAEAKRKIAAEANAKEDAKIAAVAKVKVEEEARARAEAEAKFNTATETKAAEEVRMTETRAAGTSKSNVRKEAGAKAGKEAKLKTGVETKAKRKARLRAAKTARKKALALAAAAKEKKENGARVSTHAKAAGHKAAKKQKPAKISANCVWFYTCEGDRLGPVTLEELRVMATDSSLDPRLDMVWKQTMDAWKPAGQIDGLFERPSVPAEATGNAAAWAEKKPLPSQRQTYRTLMGKNADWPGARRRSFLLITPIILFAWQFALAAASPFLTKQFGEVLITGILPVASLIPLVVLVYFGLRRLANVGMSRWWYLAIFAPILNLWVGYRCFACPPGYAYHKKMDGPGFALALLYFFIVLLGTLLLTDSIARRSGSHNEQALRTHFREAIHAASSPNTKTGAVAKATGLLSDF